MDFLLLIISTHLTTLNVLNAKSWVVLRGTRVSFLLKSHICELDWREHGKISPIMRQLLVNNIIYLLKSSKRFFESPHVLIYWSIKNKFSPDSTYHCLPESKQAGAHRLRIPFPIYVKESPPKTTQIWTFVVSSTSSAIMHDNTFFTYNNFQVHPS